MRTLRVAIAASALLLAPAAFAETAAPATEAAAPAAKTISRAEAKSLAKAYIKDNKLRNARVGDVRAGEDAYSVQIVSLEGVPLATLVFDATTGALKGRT